MRKSSSFSVLIFVVILGIGVAVAYAMHGISNIFRRHMDNRASRLSLPPLFSSAIQVADQWNRAVVLRLGKFRSLEGPGLFLIIPMIENIPYWLDTPRPYELLQGGKNSDERHRASGCGCGVVLEDCGPQEGGPGCS